MVFESIVAYFLDKYLSSYLDNFDSSKLKIGIWSGDVVLENLYLKQNALDDLNLPIRVVFGHLKELKLKIPWKSLYTESVKATIDGLTILVAPKSSVNYDPERDRKETREKKLSEVKRLIELEKSKQQLKSKPDSSQDSGSDTFTERIQLQVIRNIELTIKNIHVRYEDDFTKPEHPFSAGITLDAIEIRTTDENWNPTYLKDNTTFIINKLASLASLAIYCDSDDILLNKMTKEVAITKLQRMIKETVGINYILRPLSLKTKALLNMKPEQDHFKTPIFDFTILLESIGLNMNRLQYFDLIDMLNTIDLMALNAKYQKYRPALRTNRKLMWKFAYTAITETQIRPKREQFKWEHIKLITKTRRDYVHLLKKKLKTSKALSQADQEAERKCEEILDVFNLVLARKQADVEAAREVQQQQEAASMTKSNSWWGWASRSSSSSSISSESSNEDQQKIQEAINLSKEEKAKLYDAIGYTGQDGASQYPNDFVNMKIKFLLQRFEVKLIDGEYKSSEKPTYISKTSLIHLLVNNMEINFYQYPVLKGFK